MTIATEIRKAGPYLGDGVNKTFPFAFKIFQPEYLLVVYADPDGIERILALHSEYTVSLNTDQDSSPGGAITTSFAPPAGYRLVLTSKIPALQEADFTNHGGFYPRHLNQVSDWVVSLIQQLKVDVARAVKVALTTDKTPDELLQSVYDSASNAKNAEREAIVSASSAKNAAESAESALNSTLAAKTSVEGAVSQAQQYAESAERSVSSISRAVDQAATSATAAANAAISADASKTSVQASANNAASSATSAGVAAANASSSATTAINAATSAETSEISSQTSAANAANSASQAATSATAAANAATSADASKTSAQASANNAASSATSAGMAATNASSSATTAANYANAAQTSATNAVNSAAQVAASAAMATIPTGAIQDFFRPTAPTGWLALNGQQILRQDYPNLYDLIAPFCQAGTVANSLILPNASGTFSKAVSQGRTLGSFEKGTLVSAQWNNSLGTDSWLGVITTLNPTGTSVLNIVGMDELSSSDFSNRYPKATFTAVRGNTQAIYDFSSVGVARPNNIAYLRCIKT